MFYDIQNQLNEKGEFSVKHRILTPNGNLKWVDNNGKFIFDENNIPIRLDGIVTDRTKQYQAEEELDLELKLQEALIDTASTYINLDPKDVENTINRSLEKMGQFVLGLDYEYTLETFENNFDVTGHLKTYIIGSFSLAILCASICGVLGFIFFSIFEKKKITLQNG